MVNLDYKGYEPTWSKLEGDHEDGELQYQEMMHQLV